MKVLHVGNHLCPRTWKLAKSQADRGEVKPYRLGFQVGFQKDVKQFALNCVVNDRDLLQFKNALAEFESIVDIIHYHNEPDWPVEFIKNNTTKPVIWDVHDIGYVRKGEAPSEEEKRAYAAADGILTVSMGLIGPIEALGPDDCDKPIDWWGTHIPLSMFQKHDNYNFDELFLCSGLRDIPGHYRNWAPFLEEVSQNYPIAVFSGSVPIPAAYTKSEKYFVYPPVDLEDLLKYQSTFEISLIGFPYPNPLCDIARPNKLFEALAAGTPVIVVDPEDSLDMSTFVKSHNFGVSVKCAAEVPDAIEQIRRNKCSVSVLNDRDMYSMDREEIRVEEFYKKVLERY